MKKLKLKDGFRNYGERNILESISFGDLVDIRRVFSGMVILHKPKFYDAKLQSQFIDFCENNIEFKTIESALNNVNDFISYL